MKDFGHIISFVCAKQLLEPMRPVITSLQGKLAEVYFGFKKIEEVIYICEETREKPDERFHSVYAEAVSLAEKFGSEEKQPRLCGRQKNRENIPSETVKEYWQRSVYLPFLDVACAEMKSRFSQEMRAHYELCELTPEVVLEHDDDKINELNQCLTEVESYYAYACIFPWRIYQIKIALEATTK